jgi:DNA-binding MarR family transcriptional regulator
LAAKPADHPVLQVFASIRLIDEEVREAIAACLPEGLTVPQYEVLRLLDFRGQGLTPAEIAETLHIPKSGLTNTLQRLEANGYARIEPCADDGRKKRVWMTPAGGQAFAEALAGIRPKMEHLREAFTLDEFREALPFLKALHAWFKEKDWA